MLKLIVLITGLTCAIVGIGMMIFNLPSLIKEFKEMIGNDR